MNVEPTEQSRAAQDNQARPALPVWPIGLSSSAAAPLLLVGLAIPMLLFAEHSATKPVAEAAAGLVLTAMALTASRYSLAYPLAALLALVVSLCCGVPRFAA